MKNVVYLFSIILLHLNLSCSASKTETKETVDTTTVEQTDLIVKNGNSLLWKVEKPTSKTSYLYGTMHMINEEFYVFPENLSKRIAKSEAIIMEMDGIPNPLSTFSLMSLDTGTIHDYFNEEQRIELLKFMDEEFGMQPKDFDNTYKSMKPFVLLQGITQHYFEPTAKSYDLTIMSIAHEKNIPLIGLETIEEQLGFFDQVPPAAMAKMIIESIRNFDEEQRNTLKLMKLYSKQKVDKLIPLLEKSSPEFMEFEDLFLYNRNAAWLPKIKTQMNEKTCFIAVGAGHLFGEKGLIDLLKKDGYTVTPISTNH